FIEGLCGASWTEQDPGAAISTNDRGPNPTLLRRPRLSVLGPVGSAGIGLEVRGPSPLGLLAEAHVVWSPARDLEGPVIPLTLAATWHAPNAFTPPRGSPSWG